MLDELRKLCEATLRSEDEENQEALDGFLNVRDSNARTAAIILAALAEAEGRGRTNALPSPN
jgi:hypothetical protein